MKLDCNMVRYLTKDDWRVLTAVEMGQKNHEIVPVPLIDSIAALKRGGTYTCLKTLLKHKLLHHDGSKYDGFRLTYLGYDYLALRTFVARGTVAAVGRQIGVGKESDVFEVINEDGECLALKLHRLGRTSFRAVKSKRDYLARGRHYSWLYLSRLAAVKEFAFMEALEKQGLPVPRAVDHNRHAVLMSMVDAYPFTQVRELANPMVTYHTIMEMLVRLVNLGLIHCDFNEFNLMIDDDENVTLIDFPQMVSTSHANAKEYFYRDVEGVVKFFERKLHYYPDEDPKLPYARPNFDELVAEADGEDAIDKTLHASGFKKHHQKALEMAFAERDGNAAEAVGSDGEGSDETVSDEEDDLDGIADTEEAGTKSRAARPVNTNTLSWLESAQVVSAVRLSLHIEEEMVRCQLECTGLGMAEGDDAPSSSGDEAEEDEEPERERAAHVAERRRRKEEEVHRRVVGQHRASAKKAAGASVSRNAMKNKAKKGRRGHSGNDGW